MESPRAWYKKKRFITSLVIVAGLISLASPGNSAPTAVPTSAPISKPFAAPVTVNKVTKLLENTEPLPGLSNDNYYTNVDGNEVHSPAYSDGIPARASAQCRDGTYSFSQHKSGTCSRHGGVATWL